MNCPDGQVRIDPSLPCVPTDPGGFVSMLYGIGLSLLGAVAFLFLIIGGYHVLTSQGDPEKLNMGKRYIFYSIAGLLLALLGFVILSIIGGGLLKVPGIS